MARGWVEWRRSPRRWALCSGSSKPHAESWTRGAAGLRTSGAPSRKARGAPPGGRGALALRHPRARPGSSRAYVETPRVRSKLRPEESKSARYGPLPRSIPYSLASAPPTEEELRASSRRARAPRSGSRRVSRTLDTEPRRKFHDLARRARDGPEPVSPNLPANVPSTGVAPAQPLSNVPHSPIQRPPPDRQCPGSVREVRTPRPTRQPDDVHLQPSPPRGRSMAGPCRPVNTLLAKTFCPSHGLGTVAYVQVLDEVG